MFYLPYNVLITAITSQLVQKGVKVIKTFQEKDRETGLASNVWNVLVEVDSEVEVPDRMRWSFAGMQGGVLVNMVGRPPKCLRCLQRGHIKFHCTAPYCHKCREVGHEQSDDCRPTRSYASLVRRSEPADQDDMDDPAETDDVTMVDQPTTSQSWADQMDQLDQAAAETQVEHPAPADDAAAPSETPVMEPAAQSTATEALAPAVSESATAPAAPESAAADDTATSGDPEDRDGGWRTIASRKRQQSASPARHTGKVRASSPRSESPADPTEGRRRTQPTAVAGRPSASKSKTRPQAKSTLL